MASIFKNPGAKSRRPPPRTGPSAPVPVEQTDAVVRAIVDDVVHVSCLRVAQRLHADDKAGAVDQLMEIYGVTDAMRQSDGQFWGQFLGRVWEGVIQSLAAASAMSASMPKSKRPKMSVTKNLNWRAVLDETSDEWTIDWILAQIAHSLPAAQGGSGKVISSPADLVIKIPSLGIKDAIDCKYRYSSSNGASNRAMEQTAKALIGAGYRPVLLCLRDDVLRTNIKRLAKAGWHTAEGEQAYDYVNTMLNVDLRDVLSRLKATGTPEAMIDRLAQKHDVDTRKAKRLLHCATVEGKSLDIWGNLRDTKEIRLQELRTVRRA